MKRQHITEIRVNTFALPNNIFLFLKNLYQYSLTYSNQQQVTLMHLISLFVYIFHFVVFKGKKKYESAKPALHKN